MTNNNISLQYKKAASNQEIGIFSFAENTSLSPINPQTKTSWAKTICYDLPLRCDDALLGIVRVAAQVTQTCLRRIKTTVTTVEEDRVQEKSFNETNILSRALDANLKQRRFVEQTTIARATNKENIAGTVTSAVSQASSWATSLATTVAGPAGGAIVGTIGAVTTGAGRITTQALHANTVATRATENAKTLHIELMNECAKASGSVVAKALNIRGGFSFIGLFHKAIELTCTVGDAVCTGIDNGATIAQRGVRYLRAQDPKMRSNQPIAYSASTTAQIACTAIQAVSTTQQPKTLAKKHVYPINVQKIMRAIGPQVTSPLSEAIAGALMTPTLFTSLSLEATGKATKKLSRTIEWTGTLMPLTLCSYACYNPLFYPTLQAGLITFSSYFSTLEALDKKLKKIPYYLMNCGNSVLQYISGSITAFINHLNAAKDCNDLSFVKETAQRLHNQVTEHQNAFTAAVKSHCSLNASDVLCSTEASQCFSNLETCANQFKNMDPKSIEFYTHVILPFATTGKAPELATLTAWEQTLQAAPTSTIMTTASKAADVAQTFVSSVSDVDVTYATGTTIAIASGLKNAASVVSQTPENNSKIVQETPGIFSRMWSWWTTKTLPESIEKASKAWKESATAYSTQSTQIRTLQASCKKAPTWTQLLPQAATRSSDILNRYAKKPAELIQILSATAGDLTKIGIDVVASDSQAVNITDQIHRIKENMSTLSNEDTGTLQKTVGIGSSVLEVFNLALILGGSEVILLRWLVEDIIPLYIRSYAKHGAKACEELSSLCKSLSDTIYKKTKSACSSAESWIRTKTGSVSRARVANFKTLTKQEKIYIIQLVGATIAEKEISSLTDVQIAALLTKLDSLPITTHQPLTLEYFKALSQEKQRDILFQVLVSKEYASSYNTNTIRSIWDQYQSMKTLSDNDLTKLLKIHASLTFSERHVVCPHSYDLRTNPYRLMDALLLCQRHNSQDFSELCTLLGINDENALQRLVFTANSTKFEPLIELLAITCNRMRPCHQLELARMSTLECRGMAVEDKMAFIEALLQQKSLASFHGQLKTELNILLGTEKRKQVTQSLFWRATEYLHLSSPTLVGDELISHCFNTLDAQEQSAIRGIVHFERRKKQQAHKEHLTKQEAEYNALYALADMEINNLIHNRYVPLSKKIKKLEEETTKDTKKIFSLKEEQKNLEKQIELLLAKRLEHRVAITTIHKTITGKDPVFVNCSIHLEDQALKVAESHCEECYQAFTKDVRTAILAKADTQVVRQQIAKAQVSLEKLRARFSGYTTQVQALIEQKRAIINKPANAIEERIEAQVELDYIECIFIPVYKKDSELFASFISTRLTQDIKQWETASQHETTERTANVAYTQQNQTEFAQMRL